MSAAIPKNVAVIGGGAAGFFAAIACAEADPAAKVQIFEKSKQLLTKVRISGGGRCNVTHHCFEPAELVKKYPRGYKELRSVFQQWQPQDTVEWFLQHGVELKTEDDGRMFPTTDDSATIANCLINTAQKANVTVRTGEAIRKVVPNVRGFDISTSKGENIDVTHLVIACGGGQKSPGHELSKTLGHSIVTPVPSLFTFHINDPCLKDLPGIVAPCAVAQG